MKLLIENFKNFLNEDVDLSVLYHGSPTSFDFKEFDLEAGVGAIYLFIDKEPARAFAEFHGGKECVYTIELSSSANIVDLIDMSTPQAQDVKDYITIAWDMTEDQWVDFIQCKDVCVFDFLDYNDDFVNFLQNKGIDGLHFWDGLDEINEPKIQVVALMNTDIIESAEMECGQSDGPIEEKKRKKRKKRRRSRYGYAGGYMFDTDGGDGGGNGGGE